MGGADTCSWYVSGNGGPARVSDPEQGIADLNYKGDHSVPTKIGKYEATSDRSSRLDAKYICHVVISTSPNHRPSRWIGTVRRRSTDTAAACEQGAPRPPS